MAIECSAKGRPFLERAIKNAGKDVGPVIEKALKERGAAVMIGKKSLKVKVMEEMAASTPHLHFEENDEVITHDDLEKMAGAALWVVWKEIVGKFGE